MGPFQVKNSGKWRLFSNEIYDQDESNRLDPMDNKYCALKCAFGLPYWQLESQISQSPPYSKKLVYGK